MEQIKIKPHYSVVVHEANRVELRYGVWNSTSHLLEDANNEGLLANIVLDLHAGISPKEIAKKNSVTQSKIESVIDYLQQLNVLQNGAECFIDYYIEYLAPMLRQPGKNNYDIAMPLILVGDKYINEHLAQQLQSCFGIEINTASDNESLWTTLLNSTDDWMFDAMLQEKFIEFYKPWQNKFIVYTTQNIDPVVATKLNRIMHLLKISWLHLAIDGPMILIGPTFVPNESACYDCFEMRVHMNLRDSENYQRYKRELNAHKVAFPEQNPLTAVTRQLLNAHAVLEIINFTATKHSFTSNKVLSIFLPTMEFIYHDVLRFPSCRTCGSLAHRDQPQLYFDFQQLAVGV